MNYSKKKSTVDRVVVCAPMDHIIYNEYYNRIAKYLGARVVRYGRCKSDQSRLFFVFSFIKYFLYFLLLNIVRSEGCSYYSAMLLASKQRSVKESEDAKAHLVSYIPYFLKNIYYYIEVRSVIKKAQIVLIISTPEPYVESVTLRILSRHVGSPCIALFGNTFLGVLKEMDPCQSPRNNFSSYKKYSLKDFTNSQINEAKKYLNGLAFRHGGLTIAHQKIGSNNITKDLCDTAIIYLHDLFDSPNVYGGNLFKNHIAWLDKTVNFLIKKNIRYYIKPHPNATKKSRVLLEQLISNNKINRSNVLDPALNIFKQTNKPRLIITVYGHVSIEAPYYGIDVVCAGSSPSDAFNFTYSPKSQKEYFDSIYNVMVAKAERKKAPDEIILAQLCNRYKTPEDTYEIFIKNPGEDKCDDDISCMEDLKNKYYNDGDFRIKVASQINSNVGRSLLGNIKTIVKTRN